MWLLMGGSLGQRGLRFSVVLRAMFRAPGLSSHLIEEENMMAMLPHTPEKIRIDLWHTIQPS